ncbi:MAG: DUF2961 domain-containing protein, partial [Pirellulales bacterium]|nr:DUF2961 domain-containing protein [Pirellulales bacterium]
MMLTVFCSGILFAGLAAAQPVADESSIKYSVDLRPIFQKWNLPTRSQGERSTCSVFTMAGAMEYALAQKQHYGTRLSVEFLNWAANQCRPNRHDGAYFSDLWQGFKHYGACLEEDLPYRDQYEEGLQPNALALFHGRIIRQMGLRLHWIKSWNPSTGLNDAHLSAIKDALNRQYPVCGGFRWPKEDKFQSKDGVMQAVPPEDVIDGHSVLLVGYRDDPKQPGGGVLLFRNTQNSGHDGAMTYEYARTYMNDAAWIDAGKTKLKSAAAPTLRDVLGPLGHGPTGRNRRVSSNQQPGWHSENLDMNWLMPGQSVDVPLLEGPGVITHIWMTSHSGWTGELNSLTLRIYYDDATEPGVEVPLGDFFAVGHGKPAPVESFPVQVSPTGSLTCFWRMPFRHNARITVTNDHPDRSTGLYWQIDYVQLDELPPETPYFYARYRREHPAVLGRDYVIADLQGSGYYVGTVMSVTLAQNGWFGEGDDFFYIDGEEVPSLQGTGSEDYFNDAW